MPLLFGNELGWKARAPLFVFVFYCLLSAVFLVGTLLVHVLAHHKDRNVGCEPWKKLKGTKENANIVDVSSFHIIAMYDNSVSPSTLR